MIRIGNISGKLDEVMDALSFHYNREETIREARKLGLKYDPADFVESELKAKANVIQVLELSIDHMTGKLVNES